MAIMWKERPSNGKLFVSFVSTFQHAQTNGEQPQNQAFIAKNLMTTTF